MNYRLYHLISLVVFLGLAVFFNNYYISDRENFFSLFGGRLFIVPALVSLTYIIKGQYFYTNFKKDILLFFVLASVMDFISFLMSKDNFEILTFLALGIGAIISFITISIYEKFLYRPV